MSDSVPRSQYEGMMKHIEKEETKARKEHLRSFRDPSRRAKAETDLKGLEDLREKIKANWKIAD